MLVLSSTQRCSQHSSVFQHAKGAYSREQSTEGEKDEDEEIEEEENEGRGIRGRRRRGLEIGISHAPAIEQAEYEL